MQKKSQVNIVPDDMGNVIRQSSNPEYGYVRLQQVRPSFTNTGWAKSGNMTTLLHGTMDVLKSFNLTSDTKLDGKIIIRESLEPFSKNNPDRDLKRAGDTGIICCVDGQPIYRKTFFVADPFAQDTLIAHDNGDAIRDAYPQSNANTNVETESKATAKDFGLEEADDIEAEEAAEEVSEVESNVEEEVEEETFEL